MDYFDFLKFFICAALLRSGNCDPTGTVKPCQKDDVACMTAMAKEIFPKFMEGFPGLGVDPSDPLPLDKIVGDLTGLNYTFTESTALGFKSCDIDNVNMSLENMKISLELICKNVVVKGHYTISGRLIILPIEGDGSYEIITRKYFFSINADLKEVEDSQGSRHVAIKTYKFTVDAQEPITFDFRNLFNGQKDLADAVLKFANENWKEVASFVQEPVVSGIIKKLAKNVNHYLKLIPVNELFKN